MVKDGQVRILMRRMNQEKMLEAAAAKAGMSDKTARKYRRLGKLPSQCRVVHDWKTRADVFAEDSSKTSETALLFTTGESLGLILLCRSATVSIKLSFSV